MKDIIIIGGGPAGLTAALYASRAGADVTIIESGAPGGKLNLTAHIENYPGIKEMMVLSLHMICMNRLLTSVPS